LALVTGTMISAGAAQQKVDDRFDYQPGDLVQFDGRGYPPRAIYKVVSCDPADKRFRQCEMIRQSPDPEGHARPFTMENYPGQLTLIGRAGAQTAAAPTPAPATPGMAKSSAPAAGAAANAADNSCPRTRYGGPAPGNRPASAALFRQKISDNITMAAYGPYWYGVAIDSFSLGSPIRNAVSVRPGVGATRVNNAAPPNATLYPVSAAVRVCEGAPAGSSSWRKSGNGKYMCFVSKDNEWTCGSSN
jgi:hypothetical protein